MTDNSLLTPAERAPLEGLLPPEYPERLRDVALTLFAELRDLLPEHPTGPHGLAWMAFSLTERLSTEQGGGNFYMHKGHSYRLTVRDRQMMSEYTGNNIPELARKYRLTETRVRQIVDAWHREYRARSQLKLAGFENEGD